jgi:predicted acyl esterase
VIDLRLKVATSLITGGPGRARPTHARAAVALLSVSLLVSGCLGGSDGKDDDGTTTVLPSVDTLSPSQYKIKAPEEVWVTTSGDPVNGETGIRINNAVYRPDVPADLKVPVYINFSPYWADTAMSEGDNFAKYMIHEYVPRGFAVVLTAVRGTGHSEGCFEVGSDREAKDLQEVVDFFAAEDWSNGNVAAGGKSYDSTTQNGFIAKFPTPNLKGLFHVEGITDMYSYTFQNGVPAREDSAAFTTDYGVGQGLSEYAGGAVAGDPTNEDAESLQRLAGDACTATPLGAASAGSSTAAGAKTAYWIERDWTRSIATSSWNGSIFFVHGFQDWNVQPSHILPWIDQVNANGNIQVLAWLHQWTKGDEEGAGSDGHVYPMRTDWNETMLRWLDAILKGKDTGLDSLYGYDLQDTDLKWHHEPTWPPTSGLSLTQVADNAATTLATDAVHISGALRIDVAATSANADPVLTAVVYDVNGAERTWIGEAVLRGVFRDSLESPTPITPGSAITYHLETYPLDHVVKAGHKLAIDLGANTMHSVVLPTQLQGVTYGAAEVFVPTASADLIEPQPVWMKCFAC